MENEQVSHQVSVGHGFIRTLIGWAVAGVSVGITVAALTVSVNHSIATTRDAMVVAAWLAALYGVGFSAAGAVARGLAALGQRGRFGATLLAGTVAAYAFFGVWVVGSWVSERLATSLTVQLIGLGLTASIALLVATGVLRRRRAILETRLARALVLIVVGGLVVSSLVRLAGVGYPVRSGPGVARAPKLRPNDRKVMLIGIDGAEWNLINPLMAAGRLPNFKRLVTGGASAPLKTILPTYSAIIWTTIATGVDENEHGVLDFTELRLPGMSRGVQRTLWGPALLPPYVGVREAARALNQAGLLKLIPVGSGQRRVKALWNILSDQGALVGVVNWFATFPVDPVKGYMVSDRNRIVFRDGEYPPLEGAPGLVFPPQYGRILDAAAAKDDSDFPAAESFFTDPTGRAAPPAPAELGRFTDVYRADLFAAAAATKIARDHHPQLLAVYLAGADVNSHFFMKGRQYLIERYYEALDRMVGRLIDAADDNTTVFVVSDHGWGFRPGEPFSHFHAPDGVLIISGSGVVGGAHFESKPSVFDITPTVLALFGLPPTHDMKGRVLSEVLAPGVVTAMRAIDSYGTHVPATVADGQQRNDPTVVERLRALGYAE
jgi:hypothetical protein